MRQTHNDTESHLLCTQKSNERNGVVRQPALVPKRDQGLAAILPWDLKGARAWQPALGTKRDIGQHALVHERIQVSLPLLPKREHEIKRIYAGFSNRTKIGQVMSK